MSDLGLSGEWPRRIGARPKIKTWTWGEGRAREVYLWTRRWTVHLSIHRLAPVGASTEHTPRGRTDCPVCFRPWDGEHCLDPENCERRAQLRALGPSARFRRVQE